MTALIIFMLVYLFCIPLAWIFIAGVHFARLQRGWPYLAKGMLGRDIECAIKLAGIGCWIWPVVVWIELPTVMRYGWSMNFKHGAISDKDYR